MKLPKALLAKMQARFDSLVAEGEQLLQTAEHVPPRTDEDMFGNPTRFFGPEALLSKLLSGELRVKSAEKLVAAVL